MSSSHGGSPAPEMGKKVTQVSPSRNNDDEDLPTPRHLHCDRNGAENDILSSDTDNEPLNEDNDDSEVIRPKRKRKHEVSSSDEDDVTPRRSQNDENLSENDISEIESMSIDRESHSSSRSDSRSVSVSSDPWSPPDPGLAYIDSATKSRQKKKSPQKKCKQANGDMESGDDMEVQHVSIHRILTKTIMKGKEENLIRKIVKDYKEASNDRPSFEEEITTYKPSLHQKDKLHFQGSPFQVKLYVQNVHKNIPLLKSYGCTRTSCTVHCVLFYYRPGDLFALTTGHGFNLVHNYADRDFPGKVAARLLSEKGLLEKTAKKVIGNERISKKAMKEHQATNPFGLLELCTNFRAELRERSSICQLSSFHGNKPWRGVQMQICLTSIRFNRKFSIPSLLGILGHLAVIAAGGETYLYRSDKDSEERKLEVDTDAHRRNLMMVSKDEADRLDLQLTCKIKNYLASSGTNADRNSLKAARLRDEISSFDLVDKHMEDFARGYDFELIYQGNNYPLGSSQPTLRGILDKFSQDWEFREIFDKLYDKNDKLFLSEFQKITLSYEGKNEITKSPLINYIEGNICLGEGVYWRLMTKWNAVKPDYLLKIHRQVVELLKDKLPKEGDSSWLPEPWLDEDLEQSYKQKYHNKSGYWIPSHPEGELPMFDMLHCTEKGQVFIFFLFTGINFHLVSKGTHIANSSLAIKDTTLFTGDQRKAFQDFYDSHSTQQDFQEKFPTQSKFIDHLSSATIVIAVAPSLCHRTSLSKEANLSEKLTRADVDEYLAKTSDTIFSQLLKVFRVCQDDSDRQLSDLSEAIHNNLKASDYVESNDNVTWRLLVCKERTFEFQEINNQDICCDIYHNLIVKYQSQYQSFAAKLGLLTIRNNLTKSNWKYKICEIPRSDEDPGLSTSGK